MWETREVTITIRLPHDIADQAEEVQKSDPEFLSRVAPVRAHPPLDLPHATGALGRHGRSWLCAQTGGHPADPGGGGASDTGRGPPPRRPMKQALNAWLIGFVIGGALLALLELLG